MYVGVRIALTYMHMHIYLGFELSFNGIISFLTDEHFSAADSESLSVHLNLPMHEIRTMKVNNVGNAKGFLYAIIDSWLRLNEPSVGVLADALDKTGYKNIAKRMKGNFSYNIISVCCDW